MMDKNIFQAKNNHNSTTIFLHGLGQNKQAGEVFFDSKMREKFPQTKFIFPQASFPNSWYGIEGNLWEIQTPIPLEEVDKRVKLNKDELLKSGLEIGEIINQEINSGVSPKNIMIVGYSQGASMALAVGLASPHSLGGVVSLAGFLPCRQEVFELAKNKDKNTPFLFCHGEQDTTVAYWLAKKSTEILKDNSYLVEFKSYPGVGHWLGEKGISDMKNFLSGKIPVQEIDNDEKKRQKLKNITDWNLLFEFQKNDFLTRTTVDNFDQLKREVEVAIAAVKNKENIPSERRKAEEDSNSEQAEPKKPRNDDKTNQPSSNQQQGTQNEQQINNFNNNIHKPQNDSNIDDKVNAIKNSGKFYGKLNYKEQRDQIEALEEDLFWNNPSKFWEACLGKIEENLRINELTIEELPPEIQADYQKIKDNKVNATRINDSIGQEGAKKRIENLRKAVKNLVGVSAEKIKELKEKLLRIIHSDNKYDQVYKQEVQKFLSQLENTEVQSSNNNFPIVWIVGGVILTVIVGLVVLFMVRNRRKRKCF